MLDARRGGQHVTALAVDDPASRIVTIGNSASCFSILQGMDFTTAIVIIALLIAGATALGLIARSRSTRVASGCGGDEHDLVVAGAEVTLVQLSSPVCAACDAMRRVAHQLTEADPSIGHREIDVVDAPEVASRHSVYSTPTTLVLDHEGHVRARLIGAVRPADARAAIGAARTERVPA